MNSKQVRGPAHVAMVAFFFCSTVVLAGANYWTSGGPGGGVVQRLVIDPTSPSTLYAVSQASGLFKSTNQGDSWTAIGNGLENLSIHNLVLDPSAPSTSYAGTSGGVFKTTDGGFNWSVTGLTSSVTSLAISPSTPATLYAGTAAGVSKTTDRGLTWTATGLLSSVGELVIDPKTPTTLYASPSFVFGEQLKSTDGGQTWVPLPHSPAGVLAIDPSTPTTLYVAGSLFCFLGCSGGVFKSTDGGSSWTFFDLKTGITFLSIDPTTPTTIYAGADTFNQSVMHGILKSTNGGASWVSINGGLPTYLLGGFAAFDLAVDSRAPANLFAATENGIFRSHNGGNSWQAADLGVANAQVSAVAIDPVAPKTLYAGTSGSGAVGDRIGFYKSTDNGLTWNATSLKGNSLAVAIDPTMPSTLYVSIYTYSQLDGIFKSVDSGSNWFIASDPLTLSESIYVIVIDPTRPTTLYAVTGRGNLLKSISGGSSWSSIGVGLTARAGTLALHPYRTNTLYAGTGDGVFKTTDSGSTWSATNVGLADHLNVTALVVDPAVPTTLYCGGKGIWKSIDAGGHWMPTITGLPAEVSVSALVIDPATPTTIYAGTQPTGVFRSTDGGSSWTVFNSGLTNMNVQTLVIDSTGANLHAGTAGGGVFDYRLIEPISRLPVLAPTRGSEPRRVDPRH